MSIAVNAYTISKKGPLRRAGTSHVEKVLRQEALPPQASVEVGGVIEFLEQLLDLTQVDVIELAQSREVSRIEFA